MAPHDHNIGQDKTPNDRNNVQEKDPFYKAPEKNIKKTTCKFWLAGACRNNQNCTWAHDRGAIDNGSGSKDIRTDEGRLRICHFWPQGNCRNGLTCQLMHNTPASTSTAPTPSSRSTWVKINASGV